MYRVPVRVFIAVAALMSASFTTNAAEVLTLDVDKTTMIDLPSVPGSVIIANPIIADVTMQGTKMFVLGRSFGTTNIIILDQGGEDMVHYDVSVRLESDNLVSLFRGGSRTSYNCAPTCQNEVQTGDDAGFNGETQTQIKGKLKLATGNTDTAAEAPPAPQ